LSQEIPARCAVEFIRIECVDEGSVVELLFSFAQKLLWVIEAVQGECVELEGFNTGEVVE
jgi:hypothetical protein